MSAQKTPIYAWIDETGNTGVNIFDEAQPDFLTAALITRGDVDLTCGPRLVRMAVRAGRTELHGNEMGTAGLEKISGELLSLYEATDAHFFLSRVEKKYLLCAKLFDTIFDSGENAAVAWHQYNMRPLRIILTFKVAHIIDVETAHMFWDCLLAPNEVEAIARLPGVCERLIENVHRLRDERSRTVVTEALEWAKAHPESIQIHNDRVVARQGHFPNMVAFTNLLDGLQHYSDLWKRPVARITHDEQNEFKKSLTRYHEMYSNASSLPVRWLDETYTLQKVAGSQFVVQGSSVTPGIQLADTTLWLYSRWTKGKSISPGCRALLDYMLDHAWISDFSFRGVESALLEKYGKVLFGDLSTEQAQLAKTFLVEAEERRQASMERYEVDHLPPFMRSEPPPDLHQGVTGRLLSKKDS